MSTRFRTPLALSAGVLIGICITLADGVFATKDKAAFDKIYEGKQLPFQEVDHKAYEPVVDMIKFVDSIRKQKS